MQHIGFKMKLHPGKEDEYRRRHENLWPELKELLAVNGVRDYSIFLDPETLLLFATFKIDDPGRLDRLPEHPVMKKWWAYMGDIMDANPDNSPVSKPLMEVFYLP